MISSPVSAFSKNKSKAISWVEEILGGSARNNYKGWVGGRFTVGSNPITVKKLGRWVSNTSTQTHEIAIWDEAANKLVSGNVDLNGAPIEEWATVPVNYTLSANTTYRIASWEYNGGDTWFDNSEDYTNSVSDVATLISGPFGRNDWPETNGSVDKLYIPVTFFYKS